MGVPSGERYAGGVEGDAYPVTVAQRLKTLPQLGCQGTRVSCPNGAAINAHHGDDFCPCPGHEAFIGGVEIIAGKETFRRR